MADRDTLCGGACVLRDFFAAKDARDLKRAAQALSDHCGAPLDGATDWTCVEYDFNRLFVGPMAVPAPPFASAYQTEPLLMGRPAMDMRAACRALGLMVPAQGSVPDDHLAFELDLAAALLGAEDGGEDAAVRAEVLAWLLDDHLPGWVPAFIAAVKVQADVSAPVEMAVDCLTAWLAEAVCRTQPEIP